MKISTLQLKKMFWYVLLMLFVSVCANVEAAPVDAKTALKVAKIFMNAKTGNISEIKLVEFSAKADFHNFYVFADANSFVIVSADDCVQPILAYSTNNTFDMARLPENASDWLRGYDEQIEVAIELADLPSHDIAEKWSVLKNGKQMSSMRATPVVGPLLSTTWDQTSPYNNLCPSGTYTGCVATAMAQIMKFWNYPEHGVGSHSYSHPTYGTLRADFGSTSYEWSNMTNNYSPSSSDAAKTAVATLMYHCGVSVNMNYGTDGSGAVTAYVADALKNYFNYDKSIYYTLRANVNDDVEWVNMLKNSLDNGRPLQYNGRSSSSGHSFVCDGYDTDGNFHFNWGWSGYCDGYYAINNLVPGTGGSGAGQGSYNDEQGAIFGIQPPTSIVDAPLNLTAVYENEVAVLYWDASIGASSYNVYRNGLMISSDVGTTTYTDNSVPYGQSKYYVRAVDANGLLSLPSNYAIITLDYQQPVVDDLYATIADMDAELTWTAPEWCYPESETALLYYGDNEPAATMSYGSNYTVYAGHRFPASNMAAFANKSIYKIETYANIDGDYTVYVYTGTRNGKPLNLAATKTISVVEKTGWIEIDLDAPVIVVGDLDVWTIVAKPENFQLSSNSSGNTNGLYLGTSINNISVNSYSSSYSALIRTYITDGIYTYNIYRNNVKIVSKQDGFAYTDKNLAVGQYEYFLTTNYYKGESDTSNHVIVNVKKPACLITTAAKPSAGGSVSGGGQYEHGATCTLSAAANAGYVFTNWTRNDTVVSTGASYSFTVTGAGSYVANFSKNTYEIEASANPTAGGSVSGGGQYEHGATCTLSAAANAGYTFTNWTRNDTVVSTSASYSFAVTGAGSYVANFEVSQYIITVSANIVEGGSVEGAGTYEHGANCTLLAIPTYDYLFVGWAKDGEIVSTEASYTFTVTGDGDYMALFEEDPDGIYDNGCDVSVFPNPTTNTITIEGSNISNIRVVDMLGQTLVEYVVCGHNVCIDLGSFAKGQYLLQINTDKRLFVHKVLKR